MEKITELPEWQECEKGVISGEANPLEIFIYDQEPVGRAETIFREGLLKLIDWIQKG